MRIFVFLIIFLVVRSIIRTARKAKQPARPSVPPVRTPQGETQQSGEGTSLNPDYARKATAVHSGDPAHHHHREKVVVQAEGYAGEGDPERYGEREICCDTDHTAPQPASFSLSLPDKDTLINAVVWSEILSRPKAYRSMNGGPRL